MRKSLQWQHALQLLTEADWRAQRDVGFRSAVEYTLRRAKQFFAAEVVRHGRPEAAPEFRGVEQPLSRKARLAQAVTRLAACPAGAWAEALGVLEDVWRHRRAVNGQCLRHAIEVCGEQAWRWAIYILDQAWARGPPPSVEIMNAVLGTLRLAWRSAVQLLEDMPRQRIAWSVFSCSSCIHACAVGGERLEAKGGDTDLRPRTWCYPLHLLAEAQRLGLQEDAGLCNPLLRALGRKRWRRAASLGENVSGGPGAEPRHFKDRGAPLCGAVATGTGHVERCFLGGCP